MRQRPGTLRLTWRPELQVPFDSGWSIFQKLITLNNLQENELVQLIAREPVPHKKGRLRNCADSSWIDFERFGDLLNMPARELKNGFWDQLCIKVNGTTRYNLRLCKKCWDQFRYHCVLFDLVWVQRCPWHNCTINLPARLGDDPAFPVGPIADRSSLAFDLLLDIPPVPNPERHRITGNILEYLEWWRAIQSQVPNADRLLSSLVTTDHTSSHYSATVGWQAGFATSRVPPRYGSWILADVVSTPCRYAIVTDAGRIPTTIDTSATIKDDIGCAYRSIRRHIFGRYIRRHRKCLARLVQLSRDDLLSLAAEGICATCLAYVVWRMSIENLVVMKGLHTRRTNNFRLRLTEPWPDSPSDDRTRISFTYMQFFGIWAAIVDSSNASGMRIAKQDAVSSPQILFALDAERLPGSPLRVLHCIYPAGESMAARAGQPCKSPWTLLPTEQQCAIRNKEWLQSLTPVPLSLVEVYLKQNPGAVIEMRQLWV
jgi:hypothetical protein